MCLPQSERDEGSAGYHCKDNGCSPRGNGDLCTILSEEMRDELCSVGITTAGLEEMQGPGQRLEHRVEGCANNQLRAGGSLGDRAEKGLDSNSL